jgi:hypothetical protein
LCIIKDIQMALAAHRLILCSRAVICTSSASCQQFLSLANPSTTIPSKEAPSSRRVNF